jgi:hypothetical protein
MRADGASGKATGRPIAHHHHAAASAITTSASHAGQTRRKTGEAAGDMPIPVKAWMKRDSLRQR